MQKREVKAIKYAELQKEKVMKKVDVRLGEKAVMGRC